MLKNATEETVRTLIASITDELENASDICQIETGFGIYHITDPTERVYEMLSRMVLAQRSARAVEGKNYAWFDAAMKEQYEEHKRMCEEMEKALDERKFVMYLQPMVDLHIYQIFQKIKKMKNFLARNFTFSIKEKLKIIDISLILLAKN